MILARETFFLAALWTCFTAVRWLLALPVDQPLIPDEMTYWEMARSFISRGAFLVLGRPFDSPTILYSTLLSPAFLAGHSTAAFDLARGVNAALVSSVVFPAYGLARELCDRERALIVAALSAAVPGGAYSALIMAENLYYPLFTFAFWAAYRVLAHGRARDAAACALLLFLGYFTKPHVLILVVAYCATLAGWLAAAGRRRGEAFQGLALRAVPLAGIGAAVLARTWIDAPSGPRTPAAMLLGGVSARLFDLHDLLPEPLHMAGATAALLLTVALGTGIAPVSSTLAGLVHLHLGTEAIRWFRILSAATLGAYLLVVARHTLQNDPHVLLNERYLFVLAPLLFTGLFAPGGGQDGVARSRRVFDAVLLVGLLVLLGPLARFALYGSTFTDAPSLTGLTWLRSWTGSAWAGAAATAALAGAVTLAARRAAGHPRIALAAIGTFLIALGAGWYTYVTGPVESRLVRFTSLARRLESVLRPGDRITIVDRGKSHFWMDPRVMWHLGFWIDAPITLYANTTGRSRREPAGFFLGPGGTLRPHAFGPAGSVDEKTSPSYIVAPPGFEASCPAARPIPAMREGLPLSLTVLHVVRGDCESQASSKAGRKAPTAARAER